MCSYKRVTSLPEDMTLSTVTLMMTLMAATTQARHHQDYQYHQDYQDQIQYHYRDDQPLHSLLQDLSDRYPNALCRVISRTGTSPSAGRRGRGSLKSTKYPGKVQPTTGLTGMFVTT